MRKILLIGLLLNVLSFPKVFIGNLNRLFVCKDEVPDYKSRGRQHSIKAFTLIELLVVVLIIGILSAIALPQYQKAVEKARLAEALQNLSNIQKAIDMWLLENGGFPEQSIAFIGDSEAPRRLPLSIDFESSLNCSGRFEDACASKNFVYLGHCGNSGCDIVIARMKNTAADSPGEEYVLRSYLSSFPGTWWNSCADSETDIGVLICKDLEKQGWNWDETGHW